MKYVDVFNGDADGICSLHQLRLAEPRDATLVTGPKRDLALLDRVAADAGDVVTVLDVSADVNHESLLRLLESGAAVDYFDHHGSGIVAWHPGLRAFLDPSPDVCTGVLVDRYLGSTYRDWTVVAAFGDNLVEVAHRLARSLALKQAQIDALRDLGECLNYNAYGDDEADLVVPPVKVYHTVHQYTSPFELIRSEPLIAKLKAAQREDLEAAERVIAENHNTENIYVLPDAAWSRRVRGALANRLANEEPEDAHAILTPNRYGGFTASLRAPLLRMQGAAALAHQFPTGGGRQAAAGINHLPPERLEEFRAAFRAAFH